MGMAADFANLAASRSWHTSSPKIAQLRFCKEIDSESFKTITSEKTPAKKEGRVQKGLHRQQLKEEFWFDIHRTKKTSESRDKQSPILCL
jgi:hypothetical protein